MNTQLTEADIKVDLRGLTCPAPLLGAKRMIEDLKKDQVLLLISECPGTQDDLVTWAEQTRNNILKTEELPDGSTGYYILKGAGRAANIILDIRGVQCPGPLVEAKKLLNGLDAGEVLKLISSCPGSRADIGGWAETAGVKIVDTYQIAPDEFEFYLQKGWR